MAGWARTLAGCSCGRAEPGVDPGQAEGGGGGRGWGAWHGLRPGLEVGVCHLGVMEFVETLMHGVGSESRGGRIWGFPGECLWRLQQELVGIGLSVRGVCG